VNAFLKLKQEAGGSPKRCKTEEDKDKYISDYFEHERILLDKNNIKKNPGLRRLAKLMLNRYNLLFPCCIVYTYDNNSNQN